MPLKTLLTDRHRRLSEQVHFDLRKASIARGWRKRCHRLDPKWYLILYLADCFWPDNFWLGNKVQYGTQSQWFVLICLLLLCKEETIVWETRDYTEQRVIMVPIHWGLHDDSGIKSDTARRAGVPAREGSKGGKEERREQTTVTV